MDSPVPETVPELASPEDPLIGRVVAGRYRLVKRLGSGGMGAVYRATHLETGGAVAVKVLHGSALGDEAAQRRFRLEAQNAAALRHVNTIAVHDFGVDAGLFYLVLEYLEGRPLSDLLLQDGPLPWPRAVHILRQVLKSLWEAHEHERRIIHRDIKPANLFVVDLPGEPDHVKVLDFGVSRALAGTGASTVGLIGTPFYMAPELWRGEPIDARTDLYALGCVAFQILSGHPPFVPPPSATESLYPLLTMHLHSPPPPLRTVRPDVPAPIASWVDRLLAKEPSRRPASAQAALLALEAAAALAGQTPGQTPGQMPGQPPTAEPEVASVAPGAALADTLAENTRSGASGTPLWLWISFGLLIFVTVVALLVASQQEEAEPLPATPVATLDSELGALVFSYRARISDNDKLDGNGAALYSPAAMLARDRVRFHTGFRDAEDTADPVAHEASVQVQLESVFDEHLEPRVRIAVLERTPLVEVAVYEEGLRVRLLDGPHGER